MVAAARERDARGSREPVVVACLVSPPRAPATLSPQNIAHKPRRAILRRGKIGDGAHDVSGLGEDADRAWGPACLHNLRGCALSSNSSLDSPRLGRRASVPNRWDDPLFQTGYRPAGQAS